MKYNMTLWLRDKDGKLLKSTLLFVLDPENPKTCDVGVAIGPSEFWMAERIRDISVTIKERTDDKPNNPLSESQGA